MTKQEAINELKTIYLGDSEQARNAKEMAIRSLEAWDEVIKEIKSFQEATKNPVYKLAFGSCLVSIEEHLKEVEGMNDVRDVRGRYIDADKFITTIDSSDALDAYSAITVCGLIENEPTADVRENVRGEWVDKGHYSYCSVCDYENPHRYNFCPNCGADMRKGETNE